MIRGKKIPIKEFILSISKFWFFINFLKFTACFSVGIESLERITSAIANGEVAINQTAIRAARCIAWIHYKFIIKTLLNNIENIKYYKTTKIFIFWRIFLLKVTKGWTRLFLSDAHIDFFERSLRLNCHFSKYSRFWNISSAFKR